MVAGKPPVGMVLSGSKGGLRNFQTFRQWCGDNGVEDCTFDAFMHRNVYDALGILQNRCCRVVPRGILPLSEITDGRYVEDDRRRVKLRRRGYADNLHHWQLEPCGCAWELPCGRLRYEHHAFNRTVSTRILRSRARHYCADVAGCRGCAVRLAGNTREQVPR